MHAESIVKTNLQLANEKARACYEGEGVDPLLKQICQAHGLTLREFARIFGISKSHAQDLWHHRAFPSLEAAVKISRYFEVTVEELFGWRINDDGDRRPLLVQDPRTSQVVRLNRNSDIKGSIDLVKAGLIASERKATNT